MRVRPFDIPGAARELGRLSWVFMRVAADHREVVRPYLDGDDIVDDPKQAPRRWIIDFAKLPLEASSARLVMNMGASIRVSRRARGALADDRLIMPSACGGPVCAGRAVKAEPGADAGPAAPQAPP